MKIVDAHNHLVYPNSGERANDPDITDPQRFIDDGTIDQMWFLSAGQCLRHPFDDVDEADSWKQLGDDDMDDDDADDDTHRL